MDGGSGFGDILGVAIADVLLKGDIGFTFGSPGKLVEYEIIVLKDMEMPLEGSVARCILDTKIKERVDS